MAVGKLDDEYWAELGGSFLKTGIFEVTSKIFSLESLRHMGSILSCLPSPR